jgi:riboflavin synthase
MRVGIVEVLGAEEVNDVLEKEFEKEVQGLEIKRKLVPTIDDAGLGAKMLVEDMGCDAVVVGYALEEGEKLSQAFQITILQAQYGLKAHIFRVIVPSDQDIEPYAQAAAKEIVRYFYKPTELQHERSVMKSEERKEESSFNPFALFG